MKERVLTLGLMIVVLTLLSTTCEKEDGPPDPVNDIDGNTYLTVKTGSRIWMAENLKTTRYNDGTDIPLVKDAAEWGSLATGGYCWYNNDEESYKDTYGALYNGYSVNTGKLCPVGWHVPEAEEWSLLRESLGDSLRAGEKLKEAGTVHWFSPNAGAVNSSGFTALPAGIRYFEGTFAAILTYTSYWSSTESAGADEWYTSLYFGDSAFLMAHRNKKHGFSVRCIKD